MAKKTPNTSHITVSPKQLKDELTVCLKKRLTPYVTSSPGAGKSTIVADIAHDNGLKLIDLRLSQCTPEDLQGFPMRVDGKACFTPFDVFPLEGEALPIGSQPNPSYDPTSTSGAENLPATIERPYKGWLLLLDELSSANKSVQAAAYKLILDRQVGSHNLHERVLMVACGNKITDKAVVHRMSTALQSRLIHFELATSVDDWIDWALKNDFDYRITGFIQSKREMLMKFDPDHTDKTYPCPRTWEFLNNLIKGETLNRNKHLARVAGTIGSGPAIEFLAFCDIQKDLPSWSDITDPSKGDTLPIPAESSGKYFISAMISARVEEKEVKQVLKYIQRFDKDLQIIFCRGVNSRFKNLDQKDAAFGEYASKLITDLTTD